MAAIKHDSFAGPIAIASSGLSVINLELAVWAIAPVESAVSAANG